MRRRHAPIILAGGNADDELWPRTPEYRFRVYACRGEELHCLAAAGTPGGFGEAIMTLHEDARAVGRRLMDEGALGILDVISREWIVLPWQRPERATVFGPLPTPVRLEP